MLSLDVKRKLCSITIILILIISGILTINGSILSSSNDEVNNERSLELNSPRQSDVNVFTNDYKPTINKNSDLKDSYSNNGTDWILFNVTVHDIDEPDLPFVFNGSNIISVKINFTEILGYDSNLFMKFGLNSSLPRYYNASRGEGYYEYNFKIPSKVRPGNYNISIKAIDNGHSNISTKYRLSNESHYLIKIFQANRPPRLRNAAEGSIFIYTFREDEHLAENQIEINLNDTVFWDADIAAQAKNGTNLPNTPIDTLDFSFWQGEYWQQYPDMGTHDFGNFTIKFNGSDELWLVSKENAFTLPVGENLLVRVNDSYEKGADVKLTIIIQPVNDQPVIQNTYDWIFHNENASGMGETDVMCTQGLFTSLTVIVADVDNDNFEFDIVDYNMSKTEVIDKPFKIEKNTGNISFMPTNEYVGEFIVIISVNDGELNDTRNITFIVGNENDPPRISQIFANEKMVLIINKTVTLNAFEYQNLTIEMRVFDPDVVRGLDNDELHFSKHHKPEPPLPLDFVKTSMLTANYTLINPGIDLIGLHEVNLSVEDNLGQTDHVIVTIDVKNTNDAPRIIQVIIDEQPIQIPPNDLDLTNKPLNDTNPNITFNLLAEDMDFETPEGENLYWEVKYFQWDQSVFSPIQKDAYNISQFDRNKSAKITIYGKKLTNGLKDIALIVNDDDLIKPYRDLIIVKLIVNITGIKPQVNKRPIVILTTKDPKVEIGKTLKIDGTVTDDGLPKNTSLEVIIRITNAADDELLSKKVNVTDGKFSHSFEIPEKIGENTTLGTWKIIIVATDGALDSELEETILTIQEPSGPTDDGEKKDDKEGQLSNLALAVIGIIIIIVLILLLLLFMRKKKSKEEEEREERVDRLQTKAREKEGIEEEGEVGEWSLVEDEEEEELPEEELEEEEYETWDEEEFEAPTKAAKPAKGKMLVEEEEDIFEDLEIEGEPTVPMKGKAPPMKGKLPETGKLPSEPEPEFEEEIAKEEAPEIEGATIPALVKLEKKSEKCGICLGAIKTGLMAVKCTCGKYYHDTCAGRVGECPSCEKKLDMSKMPKPEEHEEEEEIVDMDLPEDMDEFVKKTDSKPPVKKPPSDKKAEILAGLDERLAKGEISEETYLMLKKKYEK